MGFMDSVKKAGRMLVMGEVDAVRELKSQRDLVKDGAAHDAECRSVRLQWDRDDGDPTWGSTHMELVIDPEGEARHWSGDVIMRTSLAKQIAPGYELAGQRLVVRVDPADPEKVAVDWEASAARA
jgi:hypothetical protein